MEFFILIGGIIIIAVKVYRDLKRENDERNKRMNEFMTAFEFENKICDRDIQFEVDDFLKECTRKELYERLYPILSQINGFEYIMADYDSFDKYFLDIPKNVPRRALLAAQGKISYGDDRGFDTPTYLDCWTHKWYDAMWRRNNEFMIWMDKELQKHGIEPMLYVDLDRTPWKVIDVADYAVHPHSDAPVANGHYFWKSQGRMASKNAIYKQH